MFGFVCQIQNGIFKYEKYGERAPFWDLLGVIGEDVKISLLFADGDS